MPSHTSSERGHPGIATSIRATLTAPAPACAARGAPAAAAPGPAPCAGNVNPPPASCGLPAPPLAAPVLAVGVGWGVGGSRSWSAGGGSSCARGAGVRQARNEARTEGHMEQPPGTRSTDASAHRGSSLRAPC